MSSAALDRLTRAELEAMGWTPPPPGPPVHPAGWWDGSAGGELEALRRRVHELEAENAALRAGRGGPP